MIAIVKAGPEDFPAIQDIAYKTWPDTYGKILSKEQLDYMLDSFYSLETLKQNTIEKKHQFILAKEDGITLGFAAYEHHYLGKNATRLHKLYLLPSAQGKGAGKLLMDAVENAAKENHSEVISLNVNKFNKTLAFYLKNNFKIMGEEDIEIGFGYLMEDYNMEKQLADQSNNDSHIR